METGGEHYRHLWRQTLVRLLLTYLAPLLLLTVYFHVQFRSLSEESRRRHLISIAENQASTLDLFLRERLANVTNLIEDPTLASHPTSDEMVDRLDQLKRGSSTFVDVGAFDRTGTMVSYAGPYPQLLGQNYGGEPWFDRLLASDQRFVITDMYLGFRNQPHFTIAVRGVSANGPFVIRATLDPDRLSGYVRTLKGAGEVASVIVNASGAFQTVDIPDVMSRCEGHLVPPREPALGSGQHRGSDLRVDFAYCWLELTDWVLIALWTGRGPTPLTLGLHPSFLALSVALILAVFSTIMIRTAQVVRHQREQDTARRELSVQLHHAARLASVGELAAGVAHEINNPLAVIAEESGLLQDMMDPELGGGVEPGDFRVHLAAITEAAFRARDITRKLLTFVRKGAVKLDRHDLNELVEDVVGGLLEREMTVANIEVVREYGPDVPAVLCDRGQVEQVLINLVTNAIDAMPGGGRLTLRSSSDGHWVRIEVTDTGVGISPEHMARIFMPFHTTKEVGKGTGLGLSVSYGIVKGYGGTIEVESGVGTGSTFSVVLPVEPIAEGAG